MIEKQMQTRIFWISLVILALLLGSSAIYVNHQVRKGLVKLSTDLIVEIEETYGFSVAYDRMNINFFHYLQIDNLSLQRKGESLEVRRIRLYVAWWKLLFYSKALNLVNFVEISDVDIKIAADKDLDPNIPTQNTLPLYTNKKLSDQLENLGLDIFSGLHSVMVDSQKITALNIQLKRVNLEIEALWGTTKITDLYASLKRKKEEFLISLQADFSPGLVDFFQDPFQLKLRGNLYSGGNLGDLTFSISPPSSLFILKQDLSFRALWQDQSLTVSKVTDSIPLDISFKVDLKERSLYAGFATQALDMSNFIVSHKRENVQLHEFSSYWNGGASVLYYPDLNITYYESTGLFKTKYNNHDYTLDIDVSGNNLAAEVKKFFIAKDQSRFNYTGDWDFRTRFPDGSFLFSTMVKDKPLNLFLDAKTQKNQLLLTTQEFTFNNESLGSLSAKIMQEKSIDYAGHLEFTNPTGRSLGIEGRFLGDLGRTSVSMDVQEFPLLEFARVGLLPGFFAKWSMNWDLSLINEGGNFFLDGRQIEFKQNDQRLVSSSFTVNNNEVHISNLMFIWDQFLTRLTFDMQRGSSEFNGLLSVLDNDYPIAGHLSSTGLEMNGNYGFFKIQFDEKYIDVDLIEFPIGVHNEKNKKLSVLAKGNWKESFDFNIPKLVLEDEESMLDVRNIQLGKQMGKFETISFEDQYSRLNGQMGYRIYNTDGEMQFDGILNLSGENGENYLLQLYYDDFWQADFSIYRLPVERFGLQGLEGLLSTNFNLDFENSEFKLDGYFSFDGFFKNLHIVVDTGMTLSEQGISILGNHIQYGKWRFLGPVFLGNFSTGGIEVGTQIEDVNGSIKTGLTASILPKNYVGLGSFGRIFKDDFKMVLQNQGIMANESVFLPEYVIDIERNGTMLNMRSKNSAKLDFSYDLNSQVFDMFFDDPRTTLRLLTHGNLSSDQFFVEVEEFSGLLNTLNPLLIRKKTNQRILGFTNGQFDAQFFVDSTQSINGHINLNGQLRSAFSPGNKFKLDHQIQVKNSQLQIIDWVFNLPQGTKMTLNAGANLGLQSFRYIAHVDIAGTRGATFDFDINNYVKFRGRVIGWTQFEGDARTGYLSGRLEFPTAQGSLASLTKFISTTEKQDEYVVYKVSPPGYNVLSGRDMTYQAPGIEQQGEISIFNVVRIEEEDFQSYTNQRDETQEDRFTLVAGRDFTFYAPSMSLPIIQATLNPGEYVDLFMDVVVGGEKAYYLQGTLKINRGEINYFGNKFLIQNGGTILFDRTTQFNPYLDLKADYRVDTVTNRVITMHFRNHVLDRYNPQFVSSPSMPQEQIMATLGANTSWNSSETSNSTINNPFTAGAIDTSYPQALYDERDRDRDGLNSESSLGAFEQIVRTGTDSLGGTVSRMVESAVRFIPFIDTVTVKTDFISNFAIDKLANTYSVNPTSFSNNVDSFARYLDGTSIYFGTYIDKNLFFQSKIDLEEMSTLSRYADASQLKVNFYVDFQINTPFFLVDWAFNPMQNSRDVSSANGQWKFRPEVTLTFSRTFAFRDWKDLYEQLSSPPS
ncbi:MAG: translocation/assembly module TamB domain-containing protein [Spirochaetia bacterium]